MSETAYKFNQPGLAFFSASGGLSVPVLSFGRSVRAAVVVSVFLAGRFPRLFPRTCVFPVLSFSLSEVFRAGPAGKSVLSIMD